MPKKSIPKEVQEQVRSIVDGFNRDELGDCDITYSFRFKGKYLYLDRDDYGTKGPICRLEYTGDMEDWEFSIYKYSSGQYDPKEWCFPGDEYVDGTIEGAMKAGMVAYD
ncbi:MAG: hypothetical protein JXM70_08445 [Pirellulales bacterium]|nr:hypothetical protein [Pirellulales bacterium]